MVEKHPLFERFTRRLQDQIKHAGRLTPAEKLAVMSSIRLAGEALVEEMGDPFKELTEGLGPTFTNIKRLEASLEKLLREVTQQASGFTKMVRDSRVHSSVKVGTAHRIVLKELPTGTVLRKELYLAKDPKPCPVCEGKKEVLVERLGQVPKYQKCRTCKGRGEIREIRGIMLEVL